MEITNLFNRLDGEQINLAGAMTTKPLYGRILHVQRLSTEDGPGIRTTVFFKGCPLHCAWCHNPESISPKPQIQWFSVRCIGCHTCLEACPNGCLEMKAEGLIVDRERCQGCGTCADACPAGAIELLGRLVSVAELAGELSKDLAYYQASGGGVTLSGGEPTFQPDFARGLLRALKAQGISTALDTCGLTSWETLERLLPYADLVLFDLKLFADEEHKRFTGASNRRILENLIALAERMRTHNQPGALWVRTPLIPSVTDTAENLMSIGHFLAERLDGVLQRWELCAFNNLCRDQYRRLGLEWEFAQTPLMSKEELNRCEELARTSGINPDLVVASGATRIEEEYSVR